MMLLYSIIKRITHFHLKSDLKNIFIFSTPRSGSTWLMEIIANQAKTKVLNEPLNIRSKWCRKKLKIETWGKSIEKQSKDKIINYLSKVIDGRFSFMNPHPFKPYYHFFTNRSVLKIIHGGELFFNEIGNSLNGKIIFLIRHPIPVSISRKQTPRLSSFLESNEYNKHLSKEQQKLAKEIFTKGTFFEKCILDWCFQNFVPLKTINKDWIVITYEQLVVDPLPVLSLLNKEMIVYDLEKAYKHLGVPSGSTNISSQKRQEELKTNRTQKSKDMIISSWKNKVSQQEINQAEKILTIFNIDIYSANQSYPNKYTIN